MSGTTNNNTSLIAVLEAAVFLAPQIEALIPLVTKAINGSQFNDADLATLKAVADAIDAAVSAKVSAESGAPSR